MSLDELYELAEKEEIKIYDCPLDFCDGLFLKYGIKAAILLDYKKIETQKKEKCVLAEELGHHQFQAIYSVYADSCTISKCEYKAMKWAYFNTIDYKELKQVIASGVLTIHGLSEYFDVPEEYMYNCLEFYLSKYGQL